MIVSIVKCKSYESAVVDRAMVDVLTPLGGLDWVHPGMTIAIKANLVSGMHPDKAATTHPELLCSLVKHLKRLGARVIVGDSPGGLYNLVYVNRIYAATGMNLVENAGAELNQDFTQKQVRFEDAKVAKDFTYTAWLDQADAIINFCKLKTHGMMGMSAAVKNLFGTIPGTMKPEYHYRFPEVSHFSDMLIDLNCYFKPVLNIVDAVIGMEGNGPTAGTPRNINAIAASKDPYALDLLCAHLIGIDPQKVPTLQAAANRGLAPVDISLIHIVGNYAELCVKDFQLVTGTRSLQFHKESKSVIGKITAVFMQKVLESKPQVNCEECVGCRMCEKICPANAITMIEKKPVIDRNKCIKCFCCQEFCPKGAMKVHRTWIARFLEH